MSAAFVIGRLIFGNQPDRIGGAKVALACVLIEAVGQTVSWLAPQCVLVLAGVGLTGIAYALVYPSFGVEAVRRAPPQSRGFTMGAYTACLDLALGIANPVLGAIAGKAGLESLFLIGALTALCAAPIALRLFTGVGAAGARDGMRRRITTLISPRNQKWTLNALVHSHRLTDRESISPAPGGRFRETLALGAADLARALRIAAVLEHNFSEYALVEIALRRFLALPRPSKPARSSRSAPQESIT